MSEEEMFEEPTPGGDVTEDDKLWAALSLALPIIGIIMLAIEEKRARPFIKNAAVQSLIVAAVAFVFSLVLGIIPLVQCIAPFLSLGIWAYMIYLGVEAYNGKWVQIPTVFDFAKGQGWL